MVSFAAAASAAASVVVVAAAASAASVVAAVASAAAHTHKKDSFGAKKKRKKKKSNRGAAGKTFYDVGNSPLGAKGAKARVICSALQTEGAIDRHQKAPRGPPAWVKISLSCGGPRASTLLYFPLRGARQWNLDQEGLWITVFRW